MTVVHCACWQAHLLSSLVHSLLHRKRKAAESRDDGDDNCSVEETAADLDHMLRSLVDRMMKCEPEDFELVHCTTSLPSVIRNIASVLEFYCDHLKRNILAHDNYELFFSSPLKPGLSHQGWSSECPDVKNCKWQLNPVWHRMLYSCTHYDNSRH